MMANMCNMLARMVQQGALLSHCALRHEVYLQGRIVGWMSKRTPDHLEILSPVGQVTGYVRLVGHLLGLQLLPKELIFIIADEWMDEWMGWMDAWDGWDGWVGWMGGMDGTDGMDGMDGLDGMDG